MEGFMTKYQTKLRAVKYVLENNATCQEAAQKFKVSATTIHRWKNIYKLHGEEGLKRVNRLNGREKVNVVKYMLSRNLSYNATSIRFNVGMSDVRNWYLTFKEHGATELLKDKRARSNVKIREFKDLEPLESIDTENMSKEELEEVVKEMSIKMQYYRALADCTEEEYKKKRK